MSLSAGTYRLGPDNASLVVKTYHEGVAAKAGHDLIIDVTQWGAMLEVGSRSSLELDADARSLHVRAGVGGLKSLGDKDLDQIRKNIDEKVLGGAPIYFRSSAVEAVDADRLSVRGALKMHGQTHPASFELSVGPRRSPQRDCAADAERVGDQAIPRPDGSAEGARLARGRLRGPSAGRLIRAAARP
ncbi:MAG: YceI family protein [Thermoleophilaceae bacterium]|nr:YceI family protein [Thermoleophilaceae bacterium]